MSFNYPGTTTTFTKVTDYGADPTGAADSTTNFQNAMAAGPCIVPALQPSGSRAIYRVSNCVVPNGATLIGEVAGPPYGLGGGAYYGLGGTSTDHPFLPAMIAPVNSSTIRLFNVNDRHGITFRSLLLDASNVSGFVQGITQPCDGISGGATNINMDSCAFYLCKNGIGGAVAGSTVTYPTAWWVANIRNCVFDNCVNGLSDLVDAHVTDCWFSGNYNGANGDHSATTFVNCRFEWCGINDVSGGNPWSGQAGGNGCLEGGTAVQFIGCYFDTNGISGLNLSGGAYIVNVTGCFFQANGCNRSSGTTLISNSAHIIIDGSYTITVTGCTSRGDVNPTGVYAPAAFANFINGPQGIIFTGNDMSGYQGSTAGGVKTAPQNSSTTWHSGAGYNTSAGQGIGALIVSKNIGTGTVSNDIDTR